MKSFALILAVWLLALATIYLLNREHQPINGGLPLVKSAAPPRHPVAWRLNSVCTIDEHKSTEHIV